MSTIHTGGRLSDDEYRNLLDLLRRFCEHDLDQHEAWRLNTTYGDVYIHISLRPAPGASPEAYDHKFPGA